MKKKIKFAVIIVIFIFLFCVLFVLSSLGGLRFFIPHYFGIAGAPLLEKNYLVLFQNNNELRPGGGFISAYGILKFRNGMFSGLEVKDVFGDIDGHEFIEPPYPQKELLQGAFYQGYTFRDSNYFADYPKTVTEIMKMYRLTDIKTTFNGVFAVNIKVLEDALKIIDSVKAENLEFTSDNVFEMLEYSLHNIDQHDIEQIKNRKSILGPLSNAIIKKVIVSPLRWRDICDMIVKDLNEKHIMLYFFNEGLQKVIDEKGWGGAWPAPSGDFLAVVEANLAGMKSDRYIKRNVEYSLQLWEDVEKGGYTLTGKVKINIEHFGNYNVPISGPYSGYIRVYMPKGTKLKTSNVTVNNENSNTNEIFGTIVKLKPGESLTLDYTFEMPLNIFDGKNYNLDIVKQPGTIDDNYSVIIEAPEGVTLSSDSFETRENYAIWEGDLLKDRNFSFTVIPDKLGPRVAYTELTNLTDLLIVFNERVRGESMNEAFNYSIEDMDITNPGIHDNVVVNEISLNYRDLKLKFSGMTNQPGEFYKVTIKKGFDIHGNPIQPIPKEFTIVQR